MITISAPFDKTISQEFYDSSIDSLLLDQIPCPCCGHHGCLVFWGTYKRHLKAEGQDIILTIQRVLCRECSSDAHKRTHSLMVSGVVPYSQVPLADQVDLISASENNEEAALETVLEHNPLLDMNYVYRLLAVYRLFFLERLISERLSLRPYEVLCHSCFSLFCRQFMQIKKIPNSYFRPPT